MLPEHREVRGVEAAEEVLHRVEDRRGMRLHRDAVTGAQELEEQICHERDDRGARCLMPADLHAARVLPDVVGVMHHQRREPEHASLDLVEDGGAREARFTRSGDAHGIFGSAPYTVPGSRGWLSSTGK